MRKLMWTAIGFAVSCGLWAYGQQCLWILPAAVLLLISGVLIAGRKKQWIRQGIAVLLGMVLGILWCGGYQFFRLRPLKMLNGEPISLSVTASDYSYDTAYGTGVTGTTILQGREYKIRMYLEAGTVLVPGDRVEGDFQLRLTLTETENDSAYFQGQGIFLFGYQRGEVQTIKAEQVPLRYFPAVLRQRILGILEEAFSADTAPFAKALLLGDRRDLDYKKTTALELGGILHIVAVSGMHVSILYGVLSALTMRRRFLTALIGMPALLLFAAVAGFTPSVLRACLMVWLMMLAKLFQKEYDSATALAFAVLVMLLVNPLAVTSVSLQLSAGCVAGILLFQKPINGWLKTRIPGKGRIRALVCGSISVTISAMSLITPLSAYYFGTISLVSPLTNLLTLWVVNLIFNGLILTCLISPLLPAAGAFLAELLSWPIRYVLWMAEAMASFPLAAVYTRSMAIVLWLVFVYVLLAVFWRREFKQPGKLLCQMVMGLCVALLVSWVWPLTAGTTVTMLDVGQGQSILLQTEGKSILVDCGGNDGERTADIIAETLLSQGIYKLDGIILTHFDDDHAGGISPLLTRIGTDYLFLPDTHHDRPLPEHPGKTVFIWEDMELAVGKARVRIYGPVYSGLSNENSLCVLFDTENCDILITGDRTAFGERMLMRFRELPDVDILVAGHHGDGEATSEELLRQVRPETVLISVGQDNIYGHPAPALLQRLADFGCTVLRTDTEGTITIRR